MRLSVQLPEPTEIHILDILKLKIIIFVIRFTQVDYCLTDNLN